MPQPPTCPVCLSPTSEIAQLSGEVTARRLGQLTTGRFSPTSTVADTTLLRCFHCELVFAHPMVGGDAAFYDAISAHPGYYPAQRWDWDEASALVQRFGAKRVLEVGCGNGEFLARLKAKDIDGTGLDFNPRAIRAAQERGLKVELKSVEAMETDGNAAFDVAVAFQVLEHVEDPLRLAKSLMAVIRPGGAVILTTPFSPKHDEIGRWDPLNIPPHHLTRWQESSMRQLGTALGASETIIQTNRTKGVFSRALISCWMGTHDLSKTANRTKQLMHGMVHPVSFIRHLHAQAHRPQTEGRPAGDLMLAMFRKNDQAD